MSLSSKPPQETLQVRSVNRAVSASFKRYAREHGMTLAELFERAWWVYERAEFFGLGGGNAASEGGGGADERASARRPGGRGRVIGHNQEQSGTTSGPRMRTSGLTSGHEPNGR